MQQEILPFRFVMHSLKLQELHKARRRVNDVNLMTTAYTNSCYLMSSLTRADVKSHPSITLNRIDRIVN